MNHNNEMKLHESLIGERNEPRAKQCELNINMTVTEKQHKPKQ